jgi:hypothetical protein
MLPQYARNMEWELLVIGWLFSLIMPSKLPDAVAAASRSFERHTAYSHQELE